MGGGALGQNLWDPRAEGVGRDGGRLLGPRGGKGLEMRAGGAQGPLSGGGGARAGVGAETEDGGEERTRARGCRRR